MSFLSISRASAFAYFAPSAVLVSYRVRERCENSSNWLRSELREAQPKRGGEKRGTTLRVGLHAFPSHTSLIYLLGRPLTSEELVINVMLAMYSRPAHQPEVRDKLAAFPWHILPNIITPVEPFTRRQAVDGEYLYTVELLPYLMEKIPTRLLMTGGPAAVQYLTGAPVLAWLAKTSGLEFMAFDENGNLRFGEPVDIYLMADLFRAMLAKIMTPKSRALLDSIRRDLVPVLASTHIRWLNMDQKLGAVVYPSEASRAVYERQSAPTAAPPSEILVEWLLKALGDQCFSSVPSPSEAS